MIAFRLLTLVQTLGEQHGNEVRQLCVLTQAQLGSKQDQAQASLKLLLEDDGTCTVTLSTPDAKDAVAVLES